jgi:hypothetical protein
MVEDRGGSSGGVRNGGGDREVEAGMGATGGRRGGDSDVRREGSGVVKGGDRRWLGGRVGGSSSVVEAWGCSSATVEVPGGNGDGGREGDDGRGRRQRKGKATAVH